MQAIKEENAPRHPSINKVSQIIHEKKLAHAQHTGNAQNYYKPCLAQDGAQSERDEKLHRLRQAYWRLQRKDPESVSGMDEHFQH